MSDAIDRLKAALPDDEARAVKFDAYLAMRCKHPAWPANKRDPAKLTAGDRANCKLDFERTLYVNVFPPDVLAACEAAADRTQVVRDLEMGSQNAPHFTKEGEPVKVMILARDLEHLLAQVAAA